MINTVESRGSYIKTCLVILYVLVAVVLSVGCTGNGTITGGASKIAAEDEVLFIDRIASMESVSENDAMRGMLLMLDGKDDCADFANRIERLSDRKIVSRDWNFDAAGLLSRGRMAYMVCRACDIRGGVVMMVAGPSTRYCLRELRYRGIVINPSEAGHVTGAEFVAVLMRAKKYIETGRVVEMGPAPSGL